METVKRRKNMVTFFLREYRQNELVKSKSLLEALITTASSSRDSNTRQAAAGTVFAAARCLFENKYDRK
jgi:hypothetical protein